MTLSRLPTRCKQCKAKFTPEEKARGHVLHSECVEAWCKENVPKLEKKRVQLARKRDAEGRRVLRAKKAAMKTIPELIKEAQVAFNAFIRARDRNKPCICCGLPLAAGDIGGAYDCGHYRSVGSASHLRFNELNAAGQRKRCNRYGAGRAVDYRIGLIARIGLEAVEALEADNRVHKWERDELIAIRDKYRAKKKELEKEQSE